MTDETNVPTCPGCHFGCSLDAYKCGRGKGFNKLWQEGKPVPERSAPPMARGEKSAGGHAGSDARAGSVPPVGARVMHGLNIMANVLHDRHAESAERKVLAAIARQGGFFAVDMLPKRTLIDGETMFDVADVLAEAGFVVCDRDEVAGDILRITDVGKEQQAEWNAEREAATAEFLAPLSEDEQAQLADMLFRLIQPQMARKVL